MIYRAGLLKSFSGCIILPIACILYLGASIFAYGESYDLLLRGGEVMDGSGASARQADVAIRDGRIAAIGDLSDSDADRIVDATGLTVVPGFIDLHSHADGTGNSSGLRSRDPIRRGAPNMVTQGVTTVVVNQDGRSPFDLHRQRAQLEERGFGPNVVLMVGHNTLRRGALQSASKARAATDEEIEIMRSMLRDGMEAGAWGLSAGLEYEPGIWSTTDELIALVQDIVPYGGVYIVHERSSGLDPMWFSPTQDAAEPPTMLDSILETIEIGEKTGATVVATHIKARGRAYWGMSEAMVEAINAARNRGVRIFADQYPYDSSGSDGTIVLIPHWIFDDFDGDSTDYTGALLHTLTNDAAASNLAKDVIHMIMRRGGPSNIVIFRHPNRSLIGKTIAEAAAFRKVTPVEMVYLLQFEGYRDRFGGVLLRGFSMNETDIRTFAAQPWVATASDAGVALPDDGLIHARYYGTFPRKIRKYALEDDLISVEQAIRSMTSLPAEIMGFADRGLVQEGYRADLALIDLKTVRDTATFFKPHQYASGIPYVFVNGVAVVENSTPTYKLPGLVLTPANSRRHLHTDD